VKPPRGAKLLCSLIVSPLADTNPKQYRKELERIADNRTLNIDVRLTAALKAYRLKTRNKQK